MYTPSFRYLSRAAGFVHNHLRSKGLVQSSCVGSLLVTSGCKGLYPGQIRDKPASVPRRLLLLISVLPMGCFVLGTGTSRRHRNRPSVGAVDGRYSSEFQHSTEDQVRRCRELAAAKGIEVPDEYVFIDEAITGRRRRREGYQALLKALASGKVGAVVLMATSRIHRRFYKALQFANEEVVSQGIRFLTVAKSIDSDDGDQWETLLQVYGIVDELQTSLYKENIRAAHEGLLLSRKVFGTIAFGYTGQEIKGEYLRNGKPRRRIVIQPDEAAWVLKVFRWYVEDRLPRAEIVRRLNTAVLCCRPGR